MDTRIVQVGDGESVEFTVATIRDCLMVAHPGRELMVDEIMRKSASETCWVGGEYRGIVFYAIGPGGDWSD